MSDDSPQSPPRRSTIDSEGSDPPSPVAMPESSPNQAEMATVDLEAAPTTTAAPPTQPLPPTTRQPSPRRTDRQSMAIDAPSPPESGPSLASPQAAPEMTVDQDEGDVYGGFRRRFKLKKSRSTEPWSTTRKPRLPAIKRRIASAWAHNYFWLFLVVLAVVTSISAFVMDETAANLRKGLVNGVLRTGGSQKDYGVILYIFLRVCITLIAVELTKRVAPIAAGSGIPEVKSILAGFSIPGFLEPRTLVAKVLGVVLLLGAGLPIGKEGPFIHTAAILAELLMRVPFFARHTNELFRNQMLSAAAAVGVSAAFGAPIGGILFSIEATANYYATSHYWGAFLCATVGAFTSRELAFKSYGAFSPHFDTVSYKHWEVGIFLLLSALCGILGCFFVTLFTAFVGLRRRCAALKMKGLSAIPKVILGTNLGFSALVALTSGLFACWIGDFALLGTREVMDDLFSEFPLREDANPKLHQRSRWDERAGGVGASLCLFVIFTFFFSALCIGLPVSNGLVTPSFAIGAGIGRLVGEALRTLTTSVTGECPLSPAGGYAIVGAAAFSARRRGNLIPRDAIDAMSAQA
jgi:chloride channel 2